MRIVITELKKLLSSRVLLLITAAALVINAYLLFRTANSGEAGPDDYREVFSAMEGLSDEEKLDWLDERIQEFSGQHSYSLAVLYELREDCYNAVHYREYLDSIKSQARSMTSVSIFAKPDTFNYRSIVKTPPAYERVQDVQPEFDMSRGVLLAADNSFTDILSGFIMLFSVIMVMLSDREQGMSALLFSMKKGRGRLLCAKLAALAIAVMAGVVLLYTEAFIIASYIYGLGDLSRPVQSLRGFIGCNIPISVGGYLGMYLLFKFISMYLIGTVLSLIAVNTKNTLSFSGIASGVIIAEGILYRKIDPLSVYSIFRYVNLISFTKVNDIFCTYRNINFWEHPVPLIPTVLGTSAVTASVCIILSAVLYARKRRLEFHRISARIRLFSGRRVHSRLYYAFYKSLIMQRGLLVLLVFAAVYGIANENFVKKYDVADVYYKYYADLLEGEITQEKLDFCESEAMRFDEINSRIAELTEAENYSVQEVNELQRQLAPSLGFYPLRDRILQIKDRSDVRIFYDTGYKRAFGLFGYDDDMRYALIALLMCTFLVSPLIASDNKYGMGHIINSTATGRKGYIRRNMLIAAVYGAAASLMWIIPYARLINDYYGSRGISASIWSIAEYGGLPLNISIAQYIAVLAVFRTMAVAASALLMLRVSAACRNTASAVLVNFGAFVLPVIIYLLGAGFAVMLGVSPLVSGNAVVREVWCR